MKTQMSLFVHGIFILILCLEYKEGKKRQLRSGNDTNCETLNLKINDVSDWLCVSRACALSRAARRREQQQVTTAAVFR